jgi:acyl dehydratase
MMGERAPSHLRAALRLLSRGLRGSARQGRGPADTPRRRLAVERPAIPIDAERVARYRAVTEPGGAPGDPTVVPASYASTWETALALGLLADADVPLPTGGLLHLESDLVVLRPLRAGDRVRCRVELERSEPHPRGVRLVMKSRSWNAAGQLCQENAAAYLVRMAEGPAREATEPREPAVEAAWQVLAEWALPGDLGRRYARVSGDFNPVHLWAWSSRLLGYRRPILHGYCTQAMVAAALADRLWGGDPVGLRRLQIHFRRPLLLPARALLRVAEGADGRRRFQVADPAEPARPFADGEFVGGPPPR